MIGKRVARGTDRRDGLVRAARGAGAAGPPSARDPRARRCGAGQARSAGRGAPFAHGPPVAPAGDAAPGDAAADAPLGALGALAAPAHGGGRLRPPVPPVRRARAWVPARQRRPASDHRSPRSDAADGGDVAREFRAALVALPEAKALMSAEHSSRRRYADRGVARHEELRAEGTTPRRFPAAAAGAAPARACAAGRAPTRPMRPPPSPTPGSTARATAARAGSPSWAVSAWRTATAWRWAYRRPARRARRSARRRLSMTNGI